MRPEESDEILHNRMIAATFGAGLAAALLVGCAGVNQNLPQTQGADNFGEQTPSISYSVTVNAGDSSSVNVSIGTAAQDASQQGSAEQAQTGGTTGPVENSPNIAPTLSIPVP